MQRAPAPGFGTTRYIGLGKTGLDVSAVAIAIAIAIALGCASCGEPWSLRDDTVRALPCFRRWDQP
ncbi:hypothetical protein GTY68_09205 [Streptomyces sp. SID4926]|nr:hypothetical protein [Streptomyces sp. SID4926]